MKACQPVFRQLSDVGCECGNGVRIAGFKLGKGVQVALGGRVIVLLEAKRLEYAERFSLTP